jgi:hypothetical protein
MADGRFDVVRAAAKVYTAVTLVVVAFQLALAAGAPLGQFAMGGASEGAYPPVMRTFAVMQAGLLLLMAGVVLARAGVALPRWSEETRWLIWLVVGLTALSLLLNLITPSAGERRIWAPVAFLQVASSLVVALRAGRATDEPR